MSIYGACRLGWEGGSTLQAWVQARVQALVNHLWDDKQDIYDQY